MRFRRRTFVFLTASRLAWPVTARHAVYRSADGGRTWRQAGAGLPPEARINDFAQTAAGVVAATAAGLFLSTDTGDHWRLVAPTPAVALASGSRLYAAAPAGLLASDDGGRHWAPDSAFPRTRVRSLLSAGDRLYAGTDGGSVYASNHPCAAWAPLDGGLPPRAQVFALAAAGPSLLAGLYANGLYIWSPLSPRWTAVPPVKPLELAVSGPTWIAGHNPGGIFWSADNGRAWTAATGDLPANAPVWKLAASGEIALAGAADGIFRSADGGRTWSRATAGLPARAPGIAFHIGRRFLLAATA